MPKDLKWTPLAEEANKDNKQLVRYCLELAQSILDSGYRKKTLEEIKKSNEAYDQVEKPTTDPWEGACFHKDVQILTANGWKFVKDVVIGEKVITRKPISGELVYQSVNETFKYDAPPDGLIKLSNLFYNIAVTPNHKFPVERITHQKRRGKFVTTQEIKDGFVDQQRWRLPLSGEWKSEEAITLWGYDPMDFMEFLGWYISEGWAFKHRMVGIGQSKKTNPEKVKKISNLLDRMGLEYRYRNKSQFLIYMDRAIVDHLRYIGKATEKHIPRMYLDLPKNQLKKLYDAMMDGDGCIAWAKDKHRNYPKAAYYTTSKRLADDFQELCLKLGYSASIKERKPRPGGRIIGRRITGKNPQYTVSVRFTQFTRFRHDRCTIKKVPYKDKVYCVSVPEFHTIYVKQNGRPLWTGNSSCVLPLTTISCDNLEPRLVAGLVGKLPYVKFEIENEQKLDENTEILQAWFNQELQDVVKVEGLAGDTVNQLMREGTVYEIPEYSLDEDVKRDFLFFEDAIEQIKPEMAMLEDQATQQILLTEDPDERQAILLEAKQNAESMIPPQIGGVVVDPETGEPKFSDKKETLFEGGKVEIIPFHDILIPDDADDWEATPIIRRVRPTYAELMRDVEEKDGFIKKNIGPWLCDHEGDYELSEDERSPSQEIDGVKVHAKKTIPCYECYVRYIYRKDDQEDDKELKGYDEQRLVVLIAEESQIILRKIPLIELNFKNEHLIKRTRLFPRKGKSYGTSIYGKIKSIQEGASKTFNTAINVAEVTMIPWFLFTESTGLDKYKEGIKLQAGKGIPVDSIDGLYFPKFSINPDQILKWIDLWVSFWERLISIGDLQVGRQSSKDTTATETLAVIQEGNVKHNYQSSSIKEDFLSLIRTIYDLYYQYMPLQKTFLWNGKQVPIPRSSMRRKLSFRLTGSTDLSNKLIERREKESFYQLTVADPTINPVKKAEELVKAYGHTDTSEWVHPNIAQIVRMIMEVPGAEKLVMQSVQEAQQLAAQTEEQAKGAGAVQ